LDFTNKADQIKFAKKLTKFYGRVLSDISLILKDPSARTSRQELMFTKQKREQDRNKIFDFGNIGNIGNSHYQPNLQHIKYNKELEK